MSIDLFSGLTPSDFFLRKTYNLGTESRGFGLGLIARDDARIARIARTRGAAHSGQCSGTFAAVRVS